MPPTKIKQSDPYVQTIWKITDGSGKKIFEILFDKDFGDPNQVSDDDVAFIKTEIGITGKTSPIKVENEIVLIREIIGDDYIGPKEHIGMEKHIVIFVKQDLFEWSIPFG